MVDMRALVVDAADAVHALLSDPNLPPRWPSQSALPRLSVGGLAGHLAAQVFQIETVLAEPPGAGPVLSVMEHYERAKWIGADLDDPVNVAVRQAGDRWAVAGPAVLAAQVATAAARLRVALPAAAEEHVVRIPWTGRRLRLDDFLLTRLLEMVVHGDDLASSAPVAAPEFPGAVVAVVLDLLTRLAVRRHGSVAVLRALSRPERAVDGIPAI